MSSFRPELPKTRQRNIEIVKQARAGKTPRALADEFGLRYPTVRRILSQYYPEVNDPPETLRTTATNLQFDPIETPQITLDDLIQAAALNQRLSDAVDPVYVKRSMRIETDKPIAILFSSCWHLGSRWVNHEAFRLFFERAIAMDRLYWFVLGDDVEGFVNFFHARSNHEQALADPLVQREFLAQILDKIASQNRLLAGFAGQHGSDWAAKRSGEDPIKALYRARGVPFFDGKGYINLTVGAQHYRLFGSHKLPGHSQYNPNHAHKRAALYDTPLADLIFQGDKHTYAVQQIAVPSWQVIAEDRLSPTTWFLQVGTAKEGNDVYTIKSWSPGVWGWPIMLFHPTRHEIIHAADFEVASVLLEHWK